MKNKRQLLFRIAAIVIILAVAAVMFVIGRGHTIYVDNKETSYNGQTVEAFYKATVTIGDEKPAKLSKGDRGMASIMGQTLSMTVEITDAEGEPRAQGEHEGSLRNGRHYHQYSGPDGRTSPGRVPE